jgi:hypothetical protein
VTGQAVKFQLDSRGKLLHILNLGRSDIRDEGVRVKFAEHDGIIDADADSLVVLRRSTHNCRDTDQFKLLGGHASHQFRLGALDVSAVEMRFQKAAKTLW